MYDGRREEKNDIKVQVRRVIHCISVGIEGFVCLFIIKLSTKLSHHSIKERAHHTP